MSNLENRPDLSLLHALGSESGRPPEELRRLRRANRQAGAQATHTSRDPAPADVLGSGGDSRARGAPIVREGNQVEQQPEARLRTLPVEATDAILPFPTPPQRRRGIAWGGIVSFCLCVILPTIVAAFYYIEIASNQYVVQWRFTIRDTDTGTSTSAGASALSGLLGSSGGSVGPDNYMVTEYITSEQAVIDLEKRIGLRALYAKPSIDYWSRIDASLPIEKFVRYWNYMVRASFDQITGTALAEVRAFTPEDAYLVGQTLVALTEDLVNESSQRPLWEAVRYAEAELARAQERLKKIRMDLTEYRNKAAVIEPNSSVVLSNATVASALRQTIAQYQAELGAALRGGLAQSSSQVENLKRRIKATQDQLKDVESEITKVKEGNQPLSELVGRYEELDLERQFAQAMVTSTMQSLEQARATAMSKRLFIVPYVRPVLPQSSIYPNRTLSIVTVAGACTLLWTIGLLLGRSIREHLA